MPIPAPLPIGCGSRITSILRRKSYGSRSRRGLGFSVVGEQVRYRRLGDVEVVIAGDCRGCRRLCGLSGSEHGFLRLAPGTGFGFGVKGSVKGCTSPPNTAAPGIRTTLGDGRHGAVFAPHPPQNATIL